MAQSDFAAHAEAPPAADSAAARAAEDDADDGRVKGGWLRRAGTVLLSLSPLAIGYATGVSICPSVLMFDHACPGCGLTRASVALVQGDLAQAMTLNPLAPLVCPFLVAVLAMAMLSYVRAGRIRLPRWVGWPVALAAVALNVVWIARHFGAFGGLPPV